MPKVSKATDLMQRVITETPALWKDIVAAEGAHMFCKRLNAYDDEIPI
jgi:hypothetical protein